MLAIVFASLLLLAGCSSAPPTGPAAARTLVDESAVAMGGWAALDAVKSQEVITAGRDWEPMQAVQPTGEPRVINQFGQDLTADFEKNRIRLAFPNFLQHRVPVIPERPAIERVDIRDLFMTDIRRHLRVHLIGRLVIPVRIPGF